MASFLALETATDVCSVAVLKDNQIVIEMALSRPRAHSENLVPMMRDVMSYAGLTTNMLTGIAVSKGPGSYTGLRIGVSAAKGLAFSHNVDLIGVPSLFALATAALPFAGQGDMIVTAFNSRRNEVYLGLFLVDGHSALETLTPVASLQQDEIAAFIKKSQKAPAQKLILAGEGAAFVAACLDNASEINLLPPGIVHPSASVIATLGAARHKSGLIDDLGGFEPFYLNDFIPKLQKKSAFDRVPF